MYIRGVARIGWRGGSKRRICKCGGIRLTKFPCYHLIAKGGLLLQTHTDTHDPCFMFVSRPT